jgi:hypothetical protein
VADYGHGTTYGEVLARAASAIFDDEQGRYPWIPWGEVKPEAWERNAEVVLRAIGVTCLFCPAWDGSFSRGLPECAGCHPDEDDASEAPEQAPWETGLAGLRREWEATERDSSPPRDPDRESANRDASGGTGRPS